MKRRNFIKNATIGIGSVTLSELTLGLNIFTSENKLPQNAIIKDKLWLWGQNAGSHHGTENQFKLPGKNLMETREGCDFFGINKCCRVTMEGYGPYPPFDAEAEKLKDLKEVVWSAIGNDGGTTYYNNDQSDIDAVLHIAEIYPNISGAILDDFFNASVTSKDLARHSVKSIQNMRDKLHSFNKRRLDLWVVWYTHQLELNIEDYLELFDVITMWTWKGSDLSNLDMNIKKFITKTPGKRRLVGCYFWNYGEKKPYTMDQMKFQLDKYYKWLKNGEIEGIIFCSNTVADIGLETVDYTRKWISKVGKEKI